MDQIFGDRREDARYDLQLRLRYRLLNGNRPLWRGNGVTSDISRTGVRFIASRHLPAKASIELTIEWPVRFGGIYPMDLCLKGAVVRSTDEGEVIVRFTSWNFRVTRTDDASTAGMATVQVWAPRCRSREAERTAAAGMVM